MVEGHLALWRTVLMLAISDAKHGMPSARRWISQPGPFVWVCDMLGLNPDRARDEIMKEWTK